MTAHTERRLLVSHACGKAAVRQRRFRRQWGQDRSTRGTEALVLPHMTGGTEQAGLLEVRIKSWIFTVIAVLLEIRNLLAQRRVTGGADDHGRRVHVEQLPIDTGTHTLAVEAALPVLVLLRVARTRIFGMQRCFQRCVRRGRLPLQGAPPSAASGRKPRCQVPKLWASVWIARPGRYPVPARRSPQ